MKFQQIVSYYNLYVQIELFCHKNNKNAKLVNGACESETLWNSDSLQNSSETNFIAFLTKSIDFCPHINSFMEFQQFNLFIISKYVL